MTLSKRLFDLAMVIVLAVLLLPVMAVIAVLILVRDGGPVLHVAERMKTPTQGFKLYKFRTMRPARDDRGVSGADKADRITRFGAFLRRTRLDELPQLYNLLRGDVSLVGPRPPLREYVERFPELYAQVLRSRPGITGLATVNFTHHEDWLLARSTSPEETDAIYARACVPRKARIDLIYQDHAGMCFDWAILWQTVFSRDRRRNRRLRRIAEARDRAAANRA